MRWWIASLGLLVAACNSGGTPCNSDADCFAGEVCRADGYCGDPVVTVGGGDTGAGEGDASGDRNGDASTQRDAGTRDDGTPDPLDMGGGTDTTVSPDVTPPVDMAVPACFGDPFVACMDEEDPDNNSFPGERAEARSKGCLSTGFEGMDITISGRMCPLDPMDMYEFTFIECYVDEGSFVVEAILDVKDDCDPDTILFDVGGVGTCDSGDPNIRCETLADGKRRIQVLFPGESNPVVGGIRFKIETPDRMDLLFDYDLRLIVRR